MGTAGTAVTNTGPIIALSGAGHLGLLEALFDRLVVPLGVMSELLGKPDAPEAPQLLRLQNFELRPNTHPLPIETHGLDQGEAEAIGLALEGWSTVVLLDEAHARRVAMSLGLQVRGSLGVLLEAKQRGLLHAVRPVVTAMVENGYFVGPDLVERILRAAGEE